MTSKILVFCFILSFFLLFTISENCVAQCYLHVNGVDTLIHHAVDEFHNQHYSEALEICNKIINDYPQNPMGYLGAAVVYHGIMRCYWVNLYADRFDSLLSIAVEKGERALQSDRNSAECHFVYGAALGIRGLHRIREGNWWGAFVDGLKGYKNLKTAYSLNNQLYDAYFGLGLFYYYKSAKAKALTFLRLMKDEREKGIEYIKLAIDNGAFSPMEGIFYLIRIYYYEQRYDEALQECMKLKPKFFNHPNWLYLTAKVMEQKEDWSNVKELSSYLLEVLKESRYPVANMLLAECHLGIATAAFHNNEIELAAREIALAKKYVDQRNDEHELDGPLKNSDEVREGIKKLAQQIIKMID